MDRRKIIYMDDVIEAVEKNACNTQRIMDAVNNLPSAQPEQQNARIFQGVIVEYPTYSTYPEYEGKPYFSIKYTEDGQDFIGYGTYKPDVLSEYLKKYFMPSAQPDIITCGDCKRYIRHDKRCGYWNHGVKPDMWCSQAERLLIGERNGKST